MRPEPILKAWGIGIMDMELDAGVEVGARVLSHPDGQICSDLSLAFPVMTVSACGDDEADTLMGNLGISGEWEVYTSENAPFQKGVHYELLPDKTSRFVEECTYGKTEIKGPGTSDGGEFAALANKTHTYYVRYGALYQVEAPRFCFDYTDNWKVEREETSQETDWDDSPPGNFVAARIRQTGVLDMGVDSDFRDIDGGTFFALLPEERLK